MLNLFDCNIHVIFKPLNSLTAEIEDVRTVLKSDQFTKMRTLNISLIGLGKISFLLTLLVCLFQNEGLVAKTRLIQPACTMCRSIHHGDSTVFFL